jgi:hypothetical protein
MFRSFSLLHQCVAKSRWRVFQKKVRRGATYLMTKVSFGPCFSSQKRILKPKPEEPKSLNSKDQKTGLDDEEVDRQKVKKAWLI